MHPAMTHNEVQVLESFLRVSNRYLEFGSGGSTFLATKFVREAVTSVDSSQKWLDDVKEACIAADHTTVPTLIFENIGDIGEWGFPKDEEFRDSWPNYYNNVWKTAGKSDVDLYLVDGRFRVACFMSVLQHCLPTSIIMIHDFESREYYHCVKSVARQIASADDLAIFMPDNSVSASEIEAILARHAFDPA